MLAFLLLAGLNRSTVAVSKENLELVVPSSGVGRCDCHHMVWRRRKLLRSFFFRKPYCFGQKYCLRCGQPVLVAMRHKIASDARRASFVFLSDGSDLPLATTGRRLAFF